MDLQLSELVEDNNLHTTRLEVPGGWVYRSYDKESGIMGMCFVPEHPPIKDSLLRTLKNMRKTERDTTIPADHKNYNVAMLGIRRHNDAVDQMIEVVEETYKSR